MDEGKARRVDLAPPEDFVVAARSVMGGIDLDPYSTPTLNRTVLSKRILDRSKLSAEDILATRWEPPGQGRLLLMTPSSMVLNRQLAVKALREYRAGRVHQAMILLGNSEFLRTDPWVWDHPICIPFTRMRSRYWDDELEEFLRISPSGWSVILYLPPVARYEITAEYLARFHASCDPIGRVVRNEYAGDPRWKTCYQATLGKPYMEIR